MLKDLNASNLTHDQKEGPIGRIANDYVQHQVAQHPGEPTSFDTANKQAVQTVINKLVADCQAHAPSDPNEPHGGGASSTPPSGPGPHSCDEFRTPAGKQCCKENNATKIPLAAVCCNLKDMKAGEGSGHHLDRKAEMRRSAIDYFTLVKGGDE